MNSIDEKATTTSNFADTTYTILSQQSIVGLQQSEDFMADMTDDEDEENWTDILLSISLFFYFLIRDEALLKTLWQIKINR